jgi:hypothetical protein
MRNHLFIVFSPFLLFSSSSFAQEKNVSIRIIQDQSSQLYDFQTNLVLKKKGFKFQLLMNKVEGVYVFASVKDSIYRFTETSPIRDFAYLKLLELREGDKFNINKELNISETGWSYWFYNDTTEFHSFSKKIIGMGDKGIICTKSIKQLYDVADGKIIKFRNCTTPLYLFFVAVKDYDENGRPKTELLRRKVKIEWTDAE